MKRVALIDADEIAYKAAFACQDSYYVVTDDNVVLWKCKNKTDAIISIESNLFEIEKRIDAKDVVLGYKRIDSLISATLFNSKSDDYILFLSGDNNFRYDLAKLVPYKSSRSTKPVNLPAMKEYLYEQKALVTDFLEADDMLSAYQTMYDKDPNLETVICTQDKDLKTVPGLNYNPNTRQVIDISESEARYNFYYQLLIGDPTDSIPHPRGLGKVLAKSIIDPLLEIDADNLTYYNAVKEIYTSILSKGKTSWYTAQEIDNVLWEIGNLLHMHRTLDPNERWKIPTEG